MGAQKTSTTSYLFKQKLICEVSPLLFILFQSRQHLVCYFPLPSHDTARYVMRPNGLPLATDAYVILQSGPDLSVRDTFKSRAYLAQKRREDWSRVSPAVSDMVSRSGTRMSSQMSGMG